MYKGHIRAHGILVVGEDLSVGKPECGTLHDLVLRISRNLVAGGAEVEGVHRSGR